MDQKIEDHDRSVSGTSRPADGHTRLEEDTAQAADAARQRLRTLADRQKAAGADQIKAVAQAFHQAAENMEGQSPTTAGYVQDAASRLDRLSSAVRERSFDELVAQVRDFARAQPMMVFGGALVAGFALSRFLKSSPGDMPASNRSNQYDI
jgi:hypothetical protein